MGSIDRIIQEAKEIRHLVERTRSEENRGNFEFAKSMLAYILDDADSITQEANDRKKDGVV